MLFGTIIAYIPKALGREERERITVWGWHKHERISYWPDRRNIQQKTNKTYFAVSRAHLRRRQTQTLSPNKAKFMITKSWKNPLFCFTKFKESCYMWSRSSWPMKSYTITIFPKYVYKCLSHVLIHLCNTSVPDSTIISLDWSTSLLLCANWYPPADI